MAQAAAPTPAILPTYLPFDTKKENRPVRWDKYTKRLENIFVAYNIIEDDRKVAILLSYAGEELNDIVDTFSEQDLQPADGQTRYAKLVGKVTEYFNPTENTEIQKYIFRNCQQKSDNIDEFYAELKSLAKTCNFNDSDAEIKSQLIMGCKSKKVREKGLSTPNITLPNLLSFARTQQITQDHERHKANAVSGNTFKSHNKSSHKSDLRSKTFSNKTCYNCGNKWPHSEGQRSCPASGKTCTACGKMNHFAKVCKTSCPPSKADRKNSDKKKHRPTHSTYSKKSKKIHHAKQNQA